MLFVKSLIIFQFVDALQAILVIHSLIVASTKLSSQNETFVIHRRVDQTVDAEMLTNELLAHVCQDMLVRHHNVVQNVSSVRNVN